MFEGMITPLVTPFERNHEQSINYQATEELVEHLISKGVDGLFLLGSNGEFHVLSKKEKLEFAKFVIDLVDKRLPVYVGTGSCSTKEAIELSQQMENLGADALSVITPYFIAPSEEEVYGYFKDIAESVSIPIVLYNIPKLTGCTISKKAVKRLSKINNIKAIKDSSGDVHTLKGYIEASRESDLKVLVGSDSKISIGYEMGASGAIAGTSNIITETLVKLNTALKKGHTEEAEKLQNDIETLRRVLKFGTVPSIVKRSIELAGIAQVGPARCPVKETAKEIDEKINSMLKEYGLN